MHVHLYTKAHACSYTRTYAYTLTLFILLEKFNSYSLYEIEVPKEHAFNFKY